MDPTQRFSDRVADYVKYRPSYPREIINELRREGALAPGGIVADVGSGTGLLTELFLRAGHRVFGVEPNAAMRRAGDEALAGFANFASMDGSAEETGLVSRSVDLVAAGQAFHWFDRGKAAVEFRRILREPWRVALVWNERLTTSSPFLIAYEQLLHTYSTDYRSVDHRRITTDVLAGFFVGPFRRATFPNRQVFDWEGLRGRLLSSSYAPATGQPGHSRMLAAMEGLFARHQIDGAVAFEYETNVFMGRLG